MQYRTRVQVTQQFRFLKSEKEASDFIRREITQQFSNYVLGRFPLEEKTPEFCIADGIVEYSLSMHIFSENEFTILDKRLRELKFCLENGLYDGSAIKLILADIENILYNRSKYVLPEEKVPSIIKQGRFITASEKG